MPIVAIVGPVPSPQVLEVITPSQYQVICNGVNRAKDAACCYACAIELGVGLVTQFWCIFCCHGCIESGLANSQVMTACRRLNYMLFGGVQVLSVVSQQVYLNTDLVPRQQVVMSQPGAAGYVQVPAGQPSYAQVPGQPSYAQVPGQPMYAQMPGQPSYAQVPGQPMYATQPIMPANQAQVYPAPQYAMAAQPEIPHAQVVGVQTAGGYAPVPGGGGVHYEPANINKQL